MISEKRKHISEYLPLGKLLGDITKSYFGALSKRLEPLGINRHFSTLIAIDTAEEKCTQQYISNLLSIDKVTMVRILDYHVKKKFIKRVVNPKDRREHIIELTEKAKKTMPLIYEEIENMNNTAFEGLSKAQSKLFREQIGVIFQNVESLPANKVSIKLKSSK